jgi:hypothetical protein
MGGTHALSMSRTERVSNLLASDDTLIKSSSSRRSLAAAEAPNLGSGEPCWRRVAPRPRLHRHHQRVERRPAAAGIAVADLGE